MSRVLDWLRARSVDWARFLGAAATSVLLVSLVAHAANNVSLSVCSFDTTGSGGPQAACVVPTDTHGIPLSGGTPGHLLSAATNNSTSVKASAGEMMSVNIVNTTATAADLRFYNSASAPTCSSATGVLWNVPIPANTTAAGIVIPLPNGLYFSTGIAFCLTGANADNDNTNTVTGINLNYIYN